MVLVESEDEDRHDASVCPWGTMHGRRSVRLPQQRGFAGAGAPEWIAPVAAHAHLQQMVSQIGRQAPYLGYIV